MSSSSVLYVEFISRWPGGGLGGGRECWGHKAAIRIAILRGRVVVAGVIVGSFVAMVVVNCGLAVSQHHAGLVDIHLNRASAGIVHPIRSLLLLCQGVFGSLRLHAF